MPCPVTLTHAPGQRAMQLVQMVLERTGLVLERCDLPLEILPFSKPRSTRIAGSTGQILMQKSRNRALACLCSHNGTTRTGKNFVI